MLVVVNKLWFPLGVETSVIDNDWHSDDDGESGNEP